MTGQPNMSYVISIQNNHVVISRGIKGERTQINSVAEYHDYFDNEANRLGVNVDALSIYNSSTMDFPNDSTSDADTLRLVAELNALGY